MKYYFYDLETSGRSARQDRIMQFAGQRLTEDLQPDGEPDNIMIKLHPDCLPDPEAVLLTGITPQAVALDGITEVEFLRYFHEHIIQPDMVFVGYNTVRFDDEFMRFLQFRNYYDPYEWQWQDRRSRWDLLDVVRMTRALRPEGITWPTTEDGQPTNRLELVTEVNGLKHEHAHDALSDVYAASEVARLIRNKQPKLYAYLLNMRDKRAVSDFIDQHPLFVYTSGKYAQEFQKTTVVAQVARHPRKPAALVYDLRHDPEPWLACSIDELAAAWRYNPDRSAPRLPVKTLQYNRCPAIAPLGVLDAAAKDRLQIDLDAMQRHATLLKKDPTFAERLYKVLDILDAEQQQRLPKDSPAEARLYDDFINDADKTKMRVVRALPEHEIADYKPDFQDARLNQMWLPYKARNFPAQLTSDERSAWDTYMASRLMADPQAGLAAYFAHLEKLATDAATDTAKRYVLEELQLYGQSLVPAE